MLVVLFLVYEKLKLCGCVRVQGQIFIKKEKNTSKSMEFLYFIFTFGLHLMTQDSPM